jgi:hypothetical protein
VPLAPNNRIPLAAPSVSQIKYILTDHTKASILANYDAIGLRETHASLLIRALPFAKRTDKKVNHAWQ